MKSILKLIVFLVFCKTSIGQEVLTLEAAINAATQQHPLAQAAGFDVKAKRYAEKAAINLDNPELIVESPTGEFYTLGISQSFDFPTVYARQKKVAKAETMLAESGQEVWGNELRYSTRLYYLDAQYANFQASQTIQRDSFYQAMAAAAVRQFDAGEIDFLQKELIQNESGKMNQERFAAEQTAQLKTQQLATFIGLENIQALAPFEADASTEILASGTGGNPSINLEMQNIKVAESQINLSKSHALPNFSLGYMNQGDRNSPIDYRFRASVGIPLWAGQYSAGISIAKAERQAAEARSNAQIQAISLEQQSAQSEALQARNQIQYYEQQALARSKSLIDAATRMQAAGQIDYVNFLRILDEAFEIQRAYGTQIQRLLAAQYRILYLVGQ